MKHIALVGPEGTSGKNVHVCLLKNQYAQNHQMNCLLPPFLLVQAALRFPVERHYGKTSAKIKVPVGSNMATPVYTGMWGPLYIKGTLLKYCI